MPEKSFDGKPFGVFPDESKESASSSGAPPLSPSDEARRTQKCVECGRPREAHGERDKCPGGSTRFGTMDLPEGFTCDDCRTFRFCCKLIGDVTGNTHCDWFPSRFVPSLALARAGKAALAQSHAPEAPAPAVREATGEQWADQAKQDMVSTILISAQKQGLLKVWEREG